jgi:hypothetical protein
VGVDLARWRQLSEELISAPCAAGWSSKLGDPWDPRLPTLEILAVFTDNPDEPRPHCDHGRRLTALPGRGTLSSTASRLLASTSLAKLYLQR